MTNKHRYFLFMSNNELVSFIDFVYLCFGYVITETDGKEKNFVYSYDEFGLLKEETNRSGNKGLYYYDEHQHNRGASMIYRCKILNIDEEEIIIKIGDTVITGFSGCSTTKQVNEVVNVELELWEIQNIMLSEETDRCCRT